MYIKDKKVIISAAITGATHVPSLSAHLPKNPDEIIQSAVEAHKAGAAVIHIHARDEEGNPRQIMVYSVIFFRRLPGNVMR